MIVAATEVSEIGIAAIAVAGYGIHMGRLDAATADQMARGAHVVVEIRDGVGDADVVAGLAAVAAARGTGEDAVGKLTWFEIPLS